MLSSLRSTNASLSEATISGPVEPNSSLTTFVDTSIEPLAISSYNGLGNDGGRNLSTEIRFNSREISQSSVTGDMVDANRLLCERTLESWGEVGWESEQI